MDEQLKMQPEHLTQHYDSASSLDSLEKLATRKEIEPKESYLFSLQRASEVMSNYGGVVEVNPSLPTYILSDVHARRDMVYNFMNKPVQDGDGNLSLYDALKAGKVNAVVLGDVMHSESPENWVQHEKVGKFTSIKHLVEDWMKQNILKQPVKERVEPASKVQDKEMIQSLGAAKMVYDLIGTFPNNFFALRGNHDAQKSEPFGEGEKYGVSQRMLMAQGISNKLGVDVLEKWTHIEDLLPSLAKGGTFLASHAAPKRELVVQDIMARDPKAVKALAKTENRPGFEKSVPEQELVHNMESLFQQLALPHDSKWIIGHRSVHDQPFYRAQAGNRLIQIGNPRAQIYAEASPNGSIKVGNLLDSTQVSVT